MTADGYSPDPPSPRFGALEQLARVGNGRLTVSAGADGSRLRIESKWDAIGITHELEYSDAVAIRDAINRWFEQQGPYAAEVEAHYDELDRVEAELRAGGVPPEKWHTGWVPDGT